MTQEENQLLLIDLCARLPYSVKCEIDDIDEPLELESIKFKGDYFIFGNGVYERYITEIKSYLRPMSSMTEEEDKKRKQLSILCSINSNHERIFDGFGNESVDTQLKALDWLNAHHFDYRGLIEKGLALEAHEGMY